MFVAVSAHWFVLPRLEPSFLSSCLVQGPEMCFLQQIRLVHPLCLGLLHEHTITHISGYTVMNTAVTGKH